MRPGTARLAIIRVAIFAGVIAIGLVSFWQHRQAGWIHADATLLKPLKWIGMGTWVLVVVGLIGMRLRYAREAESASNARIQMLGWALGEMPAIFGGMYYFLTDDATIYLAGLGAMIVSFTLFPAAAKR